MKNLLFRTEKNRKKQKKTTYFNLIRGRVVVVQESICFHLQLVEILFFLLQVPHQPLERRTERKEPKRPDFGL